MLQWPTPTDICLLQEICEELWQKSVATYIAAKERQFRVE